MTTRTNTVTLTGHLGTAITRTGSVATARIAVRQSWKDASGDWQERTHWFSLVGFGEVSPLHGLAKGDKVTVTGRLQSSQFVDRSGVSRTSVEVVVLQAERHLKATPEATPEPEVAPEPEIEAAPPAAETVAPKKPRRRKAASA